MQNLIFLISYSQLILLTVPLLAEHRFLVIFSQNDRLCSNEYRYIELDTKHAETNNFF